MTHRKGRPRDAGSVSLFPFLAVLLCTMGALIVLLVVITQQAHSQNDTRQQEQTQRLAEEQARLRAEQQAEKEATLRRAAKLQALRDEARRRLDEKRRALAELDNQVRLLETQLASLVSAQRQLEQQNPLAQEADVLRGQLVLNKKRILETQQAITEARRKAAVKRESYAVVPYRGRNGTFRRPTYIECRNNGIIIQPEGIVLGPKDFRVPGPGNPLNVALRATSDFWAVHHGGEKPYPMLLVRPDGIEAYYVALEALQFWGSQYGYEFVDADWDLDFGVADPRLARQQEEAVAAARILQARMLAATPRRTGRDSKRQPRTFRVTPGSGGLMPVDPEGGPNMIDDADTDWGEKTDWSAGANPTQSASAEGSLPGDPSGRSNLDSFEPSGGTGTFGPHKQGAGRFATSGYKEGGGSNEGEGAFPASGGGGQGFSEDNKDGSMFARGDSAARRENSQASQFDRTRGGGRMGRRGLGAQGGPARQPAGGSTSNLPGGGVYTNVLGANGQPGGGHAPGSAQDAGPDGKSREGAGDSSTDGQNPDSDNEYRNRGRNTPEDTRGAVTNGASEQRGPRGDGPQTSSGTPESKQAKGEAAAANAGSAYSLSGANSTSRSGGGTGGGAGECIAQRRGQNWALPRQRPGAVPITRPIRIIIDSDRLLILSEERGARPRAVIPLGKNMVDASDGLATAVRKVMEGWGIAGAGGLYWRPVLEAEITDAGIPRYYQLNTLLRDSGMELVPASASRRRHELPRVRRR